MEPFLERVAVVLASSFDVRVDRQLAIVGDESIAARRRQSALERVVEEHGQHLIVPRDARQVGLRAAREPQEIAEHHDQAARARHTSQR